jgi:tripartite-type tricarboxylate transporter receptor subunit TctC
MVAPAKTPAAVIAKLQSEISAVLRLPELRERLAAEGSEAVGSSAEQLGTHLRAEVTRWAKVIHDSEIRAE